MSRGSVTFKQTDVIRAIKAAMAAGIVIQQVEMDKAGKITVVSKQSLETAMKIGGPFADGPQVGETSEALRKLV